MANLKNGEKKIKETDVLREQAKALITATLENVEGWTIIGDSKDGGIAVATNATNDLEVRIIVKKTRWGE